MAAIVSSASLWGIESAPVQIEVDASHGLPQMTLVGLPDQAVKESKERVRTAIKNSGFQIPSKKIIINLAPADIKKEGPSFDLPIAIGILASLGHIVPESLKSYVLLGELALDGSLRKTKGVLPAILMLKKEKEKSLIAPSANLFESGLVPEIPVYTASHLTEVIAFLNQKADLPQTGNAWEGCCEDLKSSEAFDFYEVRGQSQAKRAIEVAVAGAHNLLLVGPPGSGKSMLARRIPGILPPLEREEALDILRVQSAAGLHVTGNPRAIHRPFRSPHHTISAAGLVGGGAFPKPGEISLAHHGVLFLDELPEFRKDVLETLRAPLEDGRLTIARAKSSLSFPAHFMLVGAMNPCRCGFLGDPKKSCHCSLSQIMAYRSKISGPLLDRFDLHIEVPPVPYRELTAPRPSESSELIGKRVGKARKIQYERFRKEALRTNSQMREGEIRKYCELSSEGKRLLETAMEELAFSARAYSRILKVARTISDLAECENIRAEHIAEAIQYRSLDRQW
ncbi:MAG TPA: YifB family Mg chelatase-like AAA ATPase [Candidatus Omnitrophota bacterium]|nr:YifB family Mg chelatase-like AAA ATPase [Candidatus Omnitrophota bacterium]